MSLPVFLSFIGFDSVGPAELLVLFAVVLIVVGPKNLPSAARKLGSVMSSIRRAADEFKRQLMTMDVEDSSPSTSAGESEPPPPPPPDPPRSDTYIDVPPAEASGQAGQDGGETSSESAEAKSPDASGAAGAAADGGGAR